LCLGAKSQDRSDYSPKRALVNKVGRGPRVRDDYGKLYFNILDYTGNATRLFADRGDVALRGFEDPVRLLEVVCAQAARKDAATVLG